MISGPWVSKKARNELRRSQSWSSRYGEPGGGSLGKMISHIAYHCFSAVPFDLAASLFVSNSESHLFRNGRCAQERMGRSVFHSELRAAALAEVSPRVSATEVLLYASDSLQLVAGAIFPVASVVLPKWACKERLGVFWLLGVTFNGLAWPGLLLSPCWVLLRPSFVQGPMPIDL